jgi:hypothetical protein
MSARHSSTKADCQCDVPMRSAHFECDASGRIVRFVAVDLGLSGAVPRELGLLTRLEHLDLNSNQLSGRCGATGRTGAPHTARPVGQSVCRAARLAAHASRRQRRRLASAQTTLKCVSWLDRRIDRLAGRAQHSAFASQLALWRSPAPMAACARILHSRCQRCRHGAQLLRVSAARRTAARLHRHASLCRPLARPTAARCATMSLRVPTSSILLSPPLVLLPRSCRRSRCRATPSRASPTTRCARRSPSTSTRCPERSLIKTAEDGIGCVVAQFTDTVPIVRKLFQLAIVVRAPDPARKYRIASLQLSDFRAQSSVETAVIDVARAYQKACITPPTSLPRGARHRWR